MTRRVEFSRAPLRCGGERTIAVLSRPGTDEQPCIAIAIWRGEPAGCMWLRGSMIAALEAAIARARVPDYFGRVVLGNFPISESLELRIGCSSFHGLAPAVLISRWRIADDEQIGGTTTIAGAELEALARAVAYLKQLRPEAA